MCAFAIGTARDWLFRCREMMESHSFAPTGTSVANAAAMSEQSQAKLKPRCIEFSLQTSHRVIQNV